MAFDIWNTNTCGCISTGWRSSRARRMATPLRVMLTRFVSKPRVSIHRRRTPGVMFYDTLRRSRTNVATSRALLFVNGLSRFRGQQEQRRHTFSLVWCAILPSPCEGNFPVPQALKQQPPLRWRTFRRLCFLPPQSDSAARAAAKAKSDTLERMKAATVGDKTGGSKFVPFPQHARYDFWRCACCA